MFGDGRPMTKGELQGHLTKLAEKPPCAGCGRMNAIGEDSVWAHHPECWVCRAIDRLNFLSKRDEEL
jgi:hypothetical protein